MEQEYYLNVSEAQFRQLLEQNEYRCNAAGRSYMAERVKVLQPRKVFFSPEVIAEAENLGGLEPGTSFEYPNAQGGISVARVASLKQLPEGMVNPYLYCFSGDMLAPFYAMEVLRFYYEKTKKLLPYISSGKEGNKGLFKDLFYRKDGLIRKTEYDSYYAIMSQLADVRWVYANYTPCEDDDTEGNLVELYNFAKAKHHQEVTFVICSGNPFYDKRLLAEWMWQLKQKRFAEVRINLVLVHCPLYYTFNQKAMPEARISEIYLGYIAAAIGPLAKDTITFDGQTNSAKPERYLMPGVAEADWEMFREIITDYSNMGWPNYQEILYGIDHKTAVENIILADLFARASFKPQDYDDGIWEQIIRYWHFLGGEYSPKESFTDYLLKTPNHSFFDCAADK